MPDAHRHKSESNANSHEMNRKEKAFRFPSPVGPIKFLSNKIFNEVSHQVTPSTSPCDSRHKFDSSHHVFAQTAEIVLNRLRQGSKALHFPQSLLQLQLKLACRRLLTMKCGIKKCTSVSKQMDDTVSYYHQANVSQMTNISLNFVFNCKKKYL